MTGARPGRRRGPRAPARAASPARAPATSSPPPTLALAGLCSVALGVPLAVLPGAAGPYDDPKAWALPVLVALTALAWVIQRRDGLSLPAVGPAGRRWGVPAVVAAYAAWWVITTLASLAPGQSLLGNFGRGLGLLSFGAAILLFPLAWSECRSPRATRAVIDAALLGSVPVCVLALGEAAGWNPLPVGWDPAVASLTVRSTFGQHIFLGSYLVALIPLALARLDWGLREPPREEAESGPEAGRHRRDLVAGAGWVAGAIGLVALASRWDLAWWLLIAWGVLGGGAAALAGSLGGAIPLLSVPVVGALLAGQLSVVILSQARGAFLGMLAGLSVAGFALLARRRAWKLLSAAAVALVAVGLLVGALNLPDSPVASLRAAPLLGRLSRLAEARPGSPGWFRLQVWQGTLEGWQRQLGGEVLVPGLPPLVRSLVGYGLETQLVTLDRLALPRLGVLLARGDGWRAQYIVDRAHNVVLDHLVTGGLIGVGLWALLIGALLVAGVARARAAASPAEEVVRIGALGVIVAHVVEGQVGIATPMPLALFWVAAALATLPSWSERPGPPPAAPSRRAWWMAAVVAAGGAAVLVVWLETRWLLGSLAYAHGVRAVLAGRIAEAYPHFERSRALVPWVALPAEGAAYSALRLAGGESDPARRIAALDRAETALAGFRDPGAGGAAYWALSARVAFAQARAGDRSRLEASLAAFDRAAQFRPRDGQLLVEWAWALLEAGDPARARVTASRALAELPGAGAWLAWAVLARAAREMGDGAAAAAAATRARTLAPPQVRPVLESILSG